MKQVWIYPFALLSLANAVVDSNKIFTQDTTLDSSYASITSTPASGEVLEWGEIKGGSKDSPITLSTTQALNISAISNASGGVVGLGLRYKSYAKLNGDITFSSLNGDSGVVGLFGLGSDRLDNADTLTFSQITSTSGGTYGTIGLALDQIGTLSFQDIQSSQGTAIGIAHLILVNENNASIVLKNINAKQQSAGIATWGVANMGKIEIGTIQGDQTAVAIYGGVVNVGTITISQASSNANAFGIYGDIENSGSISIDSVSALQDSVGIHGWVDNENNIYLKEITSSSRAVGIMGDSDNRGTMTFEKISGDSVAMGIYAYDISNSSNITFKSITSNQLAIGMRGGISLSYDGVGGEMIFESISAPKAVGIYGGGGWYQGNGKVVFESIAGSESYGVFIENSNSVTLRNSSTIIHFKDIQSNVGINNVSGRFEISGGNASFVFGTTLPTQINSAIYNDINQGKFYLNNSTINTSNPYAFYANQEADIYVDSSKTLQIGASEYSFGGKSNLHLQSSSNLNLTTGGTLALLQSSQSQVSLGYSGYSQRLKIDNFQAQNSEFVLSVSLDNSRANHYDGGAFYDEGKNPLSVGSSAFLQIDSSNTTSQVNNTLSLALFNKTNLTQKYILLASVSGANRDNITFNSLSDGQTITITPTSGYEAEGLEIGRYDDDKTQTNYFYLVANPYEVSTTTPSTPSQDNSSQDSSQESKKIENSLFYNPSQSYLLSTFDWGKTRFAKLRDDVRSSRIWAELGAEYWKYNGTQASDESFVDFVVGGDYLFSFAKGRNALGVAVGFTGEFITQNQTLDNTFSTFDFNYSFLSLALYNVLMLDSGVYSHTIFRAGIGEGEFGENSVTPLGENISQGARAYSFSQKVGKRFFLSPQNNGFFTDLSAMVAVGYAEGSSVMQETEAFWGSKNFLSISSNASFINQNKIEALIGYKGATNSFFSFDVSAGVGLVSNHCIGGEMRYQSQDYDVEFENTPYVGGLEASVNLVSRMGDWVDTFINVSSTWSKQYSEVIDFSAGIKLRFGSI
ncbi:hypothetical protein [Helicobacter brantae]|uniref:Autotransporter domain-containing protein n=1 Tax=Helicobacter brantae TaxID=375927 RepID=A0A3D8J2L9_9HELI|nr:hypothetical protein [Helicobacter brantae]RDU71767.1 hypothetical protein CQA58_01630 [Helicobacter brantae]